MKELRWRRFSLIERRDFRRRLGYSGDCRRIDPRDLGRLRGEDARVGCLLHEMPASAPSSPRNRWEQAA